MKNKMEQAVQKGKEAFESNLQFNPDVITKLNEYSKALGDTAYAGNGKAYLEQLLLKSTSAQIDEIHKSLGRGQGNNDYKVQKICLSLFGTEGRTFEEYLSKLDGIKEGTEAVVDWAINQAYLHRKMVFSNRKMVFSNGKMVFSKRKRISEAFKDDAKNPDHWMKEFRSFIEGVKNKKIGMEMYAASQSSSSTAPPPAPAPADVPMGNN